VANARVTRQGLTRQKGFQIPELSLCPAPLDISRADRSNAGGVVTAVLEALQGVDHDFGNRPFTEYANNSAHRPYPRTVAELETSRLESC
jgi:hypothetical protein